MTMDLFRYEFLVARTQKAIEDDDEDAYFAAFDEITRDADSAQLQEFTYRLKRTSWPHDERPAWLGAERRQRHL